MRKQHKIIIEENAVGMRLDTLLTEKFPEYSRGAISKQIKAGKVIIDFKSVKASYKVKQNDHITFDLEKFSDDLNPEDIKLNIIFEDNNLVVIDKSAGVVMQPAGRHISGTLANALKAAFKEFYIVHRLDKDTSGIVLIAKNIKTKEWLTNLFAKREIKKTYIGLVKGRVTPKTANLDLPIKRQHGKFVIEPTGRPAQSKYQVEEYLPGFTLLKIFPKTGRTHQIRVHFQAMGHPVVGDALYGGKTDGLKRQFLHATNIEFTDWQGRKRSFSSPLPEDLSNFLKDARK